MTDEQYQDIERYADGLSTDEERSAFELRLQQEEDLREGLTDYLQTKKALEAHAFESFKHKVKRLDESKGSSPRLWMYRAAAVLVLLFGIGFIIQFNQRSLDVKDYFEPYADRITVMGESEPSLQEAMEAYRNQDYALALQQFEAHSEKPIIQLYQGVSYLALDSCDKALLVLQPLSTNAGPFQEASQWYSALASIQCDDLGSAEEKLKSYLQNEAYRFNRSKAQDLLEQLD